ncbi:hypothetical protein [Bradyrhizobium sp. USDA 4452]
MRCGPYLEAVHRVKLRMRRTGWIPSIVPSTDQTVYLVAGDFDPIGQAWSEADLKAADLETVIQDLTAGEYSDPLGSSASTPPALGPRMSPRTSPARSSGAATCGRLRAGAAAWHH